MEKITFRKPPRLWNLGDYSRGQLIDQARDAFIYAGSAEYASTEWRIHAGKILVGLKAQLSFESEKEWITWAAHQMVRSRSDIYKVMRLAGAPDPEAALAEERAKNQQAQSRHRAGESLTSETEYSAEKSEDDPAIDCQNEEDRVEVEALLELVQRFDWSWKRLTYIAQETWRAFNRRKLSVVARGRQHS
jgi:hypothetical protein